MKSLDTVVSLNGRHGDGEDFTGFLYEGAESCPSEMARLNKQFHSKK